mgnify:CR=1 FL=1
MKLREGIVNMIEKTKGKDRTSMSYTSQDTHFTLERFPFDGEISIEIYRDDNPKFVISVTTFQEGNGHYLKPYFYVDSSSEDGFNLEQFLNVERMVVVAKQVAVILEDVLVVTKVI